MILNIDSSAIVQHVNRMEQISRSALPVAVRQTLNKAAYDVKQNTMPEEAKRFASRKPTFFKANSKVDQAQGFDVNTMKSTVGFVPKAGDRSHSVEDLEQQEHGGQIGNRAFIALPAARTSRAWNRMVKRKLTLGQINSRIVDSMDARGVNDKQKFIKSAIHAGKGGFVLGTDKKKGNRFLMYINSVHRGGDGDTKVNSTAIYAVKAGRKVTPGSKYRGFMKAASVKSAHKMERDFIEIAEKKLNSLR